MATASSLTHSANRNAYDSIPASTTDSILVAAIPGRKIRVVSVILNQGDTTPSTVVFNSKPAGIGTAIFPPLKYAANGGTTTAETTRGWFETNVGEGLSVTTGAGSTTGVAVLYAVVNP